MSTTITIPSAIDEIVARIQSRVATFLLCREKLTKMAQSQNQSSDPSTGEGAAAMLQTQTSLEGELSQVLTRIEAIRAGSEWSFSDITNMGTFYYNLERHISGTNDLWKKYGGAADASAINWPMWGLVGLVIYLLIRRR